MYSIIKKAVLLLIAMVFGTFANAQFFSLHQSSQSYIDGKGQSVSYTGFRNQFEPIGTPGCVMGVVSLRGACTYVSGGLSFSLSGGQNSTQFKVYVPAGVTSFIFSGYLPQGMQAAVAVRMGSAPTRSNPLSGAEYANYQATRNLSTVYQRLSSGDEVIMVADGGGSFSLAGNNRFPTPLTKGAWLYFRLINGDYIDTPRATYEIDLPSYIAGYDAITQANGWGGDGDPLENGATVTPSFSIKLNGTLMQGVSSTIAITPTGANLSKCEASSGASTVSYFNNSITLTPSSTANSVTVACTSTAGGVATATLLVQATAITTATFSSFTLSPSSLLKTDTATLITVKPNTGAVVPASTVCQVMQSQKYLVPAGTNQWKINSDANVQQIAQSLTIDCGSDASGKAITSNFTIKMPLAINNPTGNGLEFNFPSGNATVADLYIAGYIPNILKNKLTGNVESAWICRSYDDSSWVYMPGAVLPRICKRSGINANDKVRITMDAADIAGIGNSSIPEYFFTFSEKTLKDAKVELYGAYTLNNGATFQFIGNESASFPVGALWVFK